MHRRRIISSEISRTREPNVPVRLELVIWARAPIRIMFSSRSRSSWKYRMRSGWAITGVMEARRRRKIMSSTLMGYCWNENSRSMYRRASPYVRRAPLVSFSGSPVSAKISLPGASLSAIPLASSRR